MFLKIVFLYNLLGLILSEQEKDDQAMKYYEKGINIDPNYGMIYNNIGLLFYKQKTANNIKKAENFYKKAIDLDKTIPEPHNNLGNLYDYLDKIHDAINCYKKASGKYIWVVGDDDYILEDSITYLIKEIRDKEHHVYSLTLTGIKNHMMKNPFLMN